MAEQTGERLAERMAEQTGERLAERVAERASERMVERVGERITVRRTERLADRAGGRLSERIAERALERTGEHVAERAGERGLVQSMGRVWERGVDRVKRRETKRSVVGGLERIGERGVERASGRVAERTGERLLEGAGERVGFAALERQALARSGKRIALKRLGRGALIAVPVLGGLFALWLFRSDTMLARDEWRRQRSDRIWALFVLAAAADCVDSLSHFVIAYALLTQSVGHDQLMLIESVSLGCAIVSTVFAVGGEIVSQWKILAASKKKPKAIE